MSEPTIDANAASTTTRPTSAPPATAAPSDTPPARRGVSLARLLTLVLPATDVTLVNGYATVLVTPMTLGSQTLTATDVWSAPADPGVPGPTLLALLPGTSGLAYGERLIAALPSGEAQTGAAVRWPVS